VFFYACADFKCMLHKFYNTLLSHQINTVSPILHRFKRCCKQIQLIKLCQLYPSLISCGILRLWKGYWLWLSQPAQIYLRRSGDMPPLASTLVPNNLSTSFANEDKAIRRLKEKFAEEQKTICQTMGWRSRWSIYFRWRLRSRWSKKTNYSTARRKNGRKEKIKAR